MDGRHLTTVYVIRWPDGVTKVGRTINPRRVRQFELRGGRVDRLIHNTTHETEVSLSKLLAGLGPGSFGNWRQSVPYLGAGGTGFSECHSLTDDAYAKFLDEVDAHG